MFSQRKEEFGFQVSIKKDGSGNITYEYGYHKFAPIYKVIVLAGGGGQTTVYAELLEIIEEQRDTIEKFGGSSAGAYFAVLAAIPFQRGETKQALSKINVAKDLLPQAAWV